MPPPFSIEILFSIIQLFKPKLNKDHNEYLNLRSKQNNKFISLDFNRIKQEAKNQENEAFADKDLNRLLMRNNLRKSK